MLWKKQQVETAMKILGKYSRVCDALPEIEKTINRKVTVDSLKHAMKQRGADAPSYYLQRDLVGEPGKSGGTLIGGQVYAERQDKLANEAVRKAENAWIRNLDYSIVSQIDHENPKSLKYDLKWEIPITSITEQFRVPGSYTEIVFGEKITKIMVCPDAHFPFVDKTAWKVFLKACKAVQPDVIVIIGDFLDCLSISRHAKKAKDEKFLSKELESGNDALDEICALMVKRVIYIDGNHERRFSSYINENAPALDSLVSLKEKLKLAERGIEHVPYGEFIRIGEMAFTHDVGRCGVNAARQSLQDFGDNLTFGHSHRAQVVYGGTVEGKTHVCMNVGWLGDYDAIDYRNRPTAKREWQHSFGFIYQDSKGVSYCNLVPIINGSCIVDGKLIRV